ncbi:MULTISPECIES: response regulator transcription factor [Kribbella]|uniref:LuxR family two component transcriptional regulator n=1 Tax=Kribbella pratensis TaxID=2512112 RepID=A0ABY2F9Q2_9ACTN|nr:MULTISPECIES: response regulator transcription factor [Kribbella]TDW87317.1 LuxR family two component transcriptional regulator [Kribbella pratensis]TDW91373.1 LuxR family two component transcriptional regulator [Kribbella sp. VKM Ac-2566]
MTGVSEPVRLLLVDDDPLVRAGLSSMLSGAPELELVGAASDGQQAVDAVRDLRPDVVLMDIGMPVLDGVAATAAIRRRAGAPEVVMLTTFGSDEALLRALRAGASGYLLKDAAPVEIVAAVVKAASGESVLSPQSTRQLMDHVGAVDQHSRRTTALAALAQLTERERDVVLAVAEGRSNAEAAAVLEVGVATVKTHLTNSLAKLQLTNRVQLALLAHDAGLV